MLRGSAIVGVFFIIYSVAVDFSAGAGAIAIVAFLALAPMLFRASMRFRLANTSWRGMRMRFVAKDLKEAYWCITPALALFLLPGVILALFSDGKPQPKGASLGAMDALPFGLYALVVAIAIPYFFWRLKRYQHNHYAWGPLKTEYRSEVSATYKVFGMTLLAALAVVLVFLLPVLIFLPAGARSANTAVLLLAYIPLFLPWVFAFVIAINILPRAYFTATMQNLIWSRTGNRYLRFKSDLTTGKFIGLQFKNYFLIMVTFGLYWPFAVVNTARMQLEAISLKTRIPLDKLSDAARARENDAAGDMAADIFGLDVGM